MSNKEVHFYRLTGWRSLKIAIIEVCSSEEEFFWDCMHSNEYMYEGKCVHFDTLFDDYLDEQIRMKHLQDRILELKDAWSFKYGGTMPEDHPSLLALVLGLPAASSNGGAHA